MKRLSTWLPWLVTALVAGLAALNWGTLTAAAPLDLVFAQVQAPLGVVLLGLAAVLVALFFVAHLRTQIGSLLENRRLLKEIQRVQALADQAEASRIDSLKLLITNEFKLLNERLGAATSPTGAEHSEVVPIPPGNLTHAERW